MGVGQSFQQVNCIQGSKITNLGIQSVLNDSGTMPVNFRRRLAHRKYEGSTHKLIGFVSFINEKGDKPTLNL